MYSGKPIKLVSRFDSSALQMHGAKLNGTSTIKVPVGCEAVLFSSDNCDGPGAVFTAGDYGFAQFIARMANDATCSLIVRDAGSAGCAADSTYWISTDEEPPSEQIVELEGPDHCVATLCGRNGDCCELAAGAFSNKQLWSQDCPSISSLFNVTTAPGCSVKLVR